MSKNMEQTGLKAPIVLTRSSADEQFFPVLKETASGIWKWSFTLITFMWNIIVKNKPGFISISRRLGGD